MNMTYNYPARQNNGQIASSVDGAATRETITYQYDALKRLVGVGEELEGRIHLRRLRQPDADVPTGRRRAFAERDRGAGSNNVPTNRISATGVAYDNNGNQTAGFGGLTLTYDAGQPGDGGGRQPERGLRVRLGQPADLSAGTPAGPRRSTSTGWTGRSWPRTPRRS